MEKILALERYKAEAAKLGGGRKCTNLYAFDDVLGYWAAKGQLFIERTGETLFVLRQRQGFYQFHFISPSEAALAEDLKIFLPGCRGELALALFGKGEIPFAATVQAAGFDFRCRLSRYVLLNDNPREPSLPPPAELAKESDALEILEILNEYFDKYRDRIPDLDEVAAAIKSQGIIIVRDESSGKISAFNWLERKKSSAVGIYLAAREEFRRKNHVVKLTLSAYAYTADIKRIVAWIDDTNVVSIAYNESFGNRPDGFKQEIYIYNVEK